MTIEQIQQRMNEGGLSPAEASEFKMFLSAQYAYLSGLLEDVLLTKSEWWGLERPNQKSDKATDMAWARTPKGRDELSYTFKRKSIEKLISSLSSYLRVQEGQSKNLY